MRTLMLMLLASVCATGIPFQAIINGRLGQMVGHPLLAALVSFVTGTCALSAILVVSTPGWPQLPRDLSWSDVPPYLFLGGLFGAMYVTVVLWLVPRIGAANVVAAGIAGQLVTSVVIDHFALLGVPQGSISLTKLAGCALLFGGMLLIQRG